MARTEAPKPRSEKPASTGKGDDLPNVVPMRKHPWLLALAIVCFTSWLGFLVAMALQG